MFDLEPSTTISSETIIGLRKIRRDRRILWAGVLGGFLAMVLMVKTGLNVFLGLFAIAYIIGLFMAQIIVYRAKCPSCGKGFFRLWFICNPYTSRCMNCGISLKVKRPSA